MSEVSPLLEIAGPDVLRRNVFRLTGLPIEATARRLEQVAETVRMKEKLGLPPEAITGPLVLPDAPGADLLREATLRIRDPERRFVEEFFWFWPATPGESASDPAINALKAGDVQSASRIWLDRDPGVKGDDDDHPLDGTVATHNLGVLWFTLALDHEHEIDALGGTPPGSDGLRLWYWTEGLRCWSTLSVGGDFWLELSPRTEARGDTRLTFETATGLLDDLSRAIARICLRRAVQLAKNPNGRAFAVKLVEGAMTFRDDASMEEEDFEEERRFATEGIRAELRSAGDRATSALDEKPEEGAKAAGELLASARDLLPALACIYPEGNALVDVVSDDVAQTIMSCTVAYVNATKKNEETRSLLLECREFARGINAKTRLERNLEIANENIAFERVEELRTLIATTMQGDLGLVRKFEWLRDELLPWLSRFKAANPNAPNAIKAAHNAIAIAFRSVSVDLHNENSDSERATAAHRLAASLCSDEELRGQLRVDAVALGRIYGLDFVSRENSQLAPRAPGRQTLAPPVRSTGTTSPTVRAAPLPAAASKAKPPSLFNLNGNTVLSRQQSAIFGVGGILGVMLLTYWCSTSLPTSSKQTDSPPVQAPPTAVPQVAVQPVLSMPPKPPPAAVPTVVPAPAVRLKNGTVIRRFSESGMGEFEFKNGTDSDAVIVMHMQDVAVPDRAAMYVRANSSATITSIPVGRYQVAFELGSDWDRSRKQFRNSDARSAFEKMPEFEEIPRSHADGRESIGYNTYSATLHGVVGGNARTTHAPPELFDIGDN